MQCYVSFFHLIRNRRIVFQAHISLGCILISVTIILIQSLQKQERSLIPAHLISYKTEVRKSSSLMIFCQEPSLRNHLWGWKQTQKDPCVCEASLFLKSNLSRKEVCDHFGFGFFVWVFLGCFLVFKINLISRRKCLRTGKKEMERTRVGSGKERYHHPWIQL